MQPATMDNGPPRRPGQHPSHVSQHLQLPHVAAVLPGELQRGVLPDATFPDFGLGPDLALASDLTLSSGPGSRGDPEGAPVGSHTVPFPVCF
mmetsp:Transcript_148284/g.259157  ORF Transcript_148284/g.259157 Transcript_148284/m.259157 type:complete len:92 (-) Transcript_148284:602-877(-)